MKNEYITLETHRTGYAVDQCGHTLNVGELIDYLSQWDEETPIYFSNDSGYTYGSLCFDDINSEFEDGDDEDDE